MEEKIKDVIGLFEMGILNEYQTVKQLLYLNNVSNRRELLIATLKGWEGYKKDGVECTIEEYVAEVESNL